MSETETVPMSYEALINKRLEASFDRLKDFIFRLRAPSAVIAMETSMLLERLAVKYGPTIYSAIGTKAIQHGKIAMGYCPFCLGTPNVIDLQLGMCARCWEDADKMDKAVDAINEEADAPDSEE